MKLNFLSSSNLECHGFEHSLPGKAKLGIDYMKASMTVESDDDAEKILCLMASIASPNSVIFAALDFDLVLEFHDVPHSYYMIFKGKLFPIKLEIFDYMPDELVFRHSNFNATEDILFD